MRRIIVDIDNTLWDLAPVLYEGLTCENPELPPVSAWDRWDFWRGHIPREVFYTVLREVHMRQDRFAPFPDARPFLTGLREDGFHVVIASHREKAAFDATSRWLDKYDLPYDDLHLSNDKSVLFHMSWGVVDDSPVVLEGARAAGIVRAGLRRPWNTGTDHPLFADLMEILAYLRGIGEIGEGQ